MSYVFSVVDIESEVFDVLNAELLEGFGCVGRGLHHWSQLKIREKRLESTDTYRVRYGKYASMHVVSHLDP